MDTFLWHDYETWGINPALDRPSQFAAIRTDSDLNEIGEPIMIYAKPPRDALPHPEAALVTGLTPQHAEAHGIVEADFMAAIYRQMMVPKTCSVGFNSLRFDDEVTRFGLYRNFYDAYEREWKQGNSRWDIIDVVRLCAALRPEGINWPLDDKGLPSYKLEALTAANGIDQQGAHDALVDVRATIDVARLIKRMQPKLFEYALSMRKKQTALDAIALGSDKPIFHISGMFGSKNYCASVVLPLCMHPSNKNEVICFDLRQSPQDFIDLDADELQLRMFSSNKALAALAQERGVEHIERIAIKSIHINKCPMVLTANAELLTDEVCERLHLDKVAMREHYKLLKAAKPQWNKAQQAFKQRSFAESSDPDTQLYGGGFFSAADRQQMNVVVAADPIVLAHQTFNFSDPRLTEMLFRYRGRNFPETLTEEEQSRWRDFCLSRLQDVESGASIDIHQYRRRLDDLMQQYSGQDTPCHILSSLRVWGDELLARVS